jgi:uncharacterized SAM-binding protein YcdF (DUF218 family)
VRSVFSRFFIAALLLLFLILAVQAAALIYFTLPVPVRAPVDLIAVFPGDSGRLAAGVDLVAKGFARNLLVGGASPSGDRVNALAARYPDFPADFRLIDPGPCRDTFQDALGAREQIQKHGFESVLLVTSDYHMLRSWTLLKLLLTGSDVQVQRHVVPALKSAPFPRRVRLLALEMGKFWGSLAQVAGGRRAEGGGRRSEVGGRRSEVGSRRSEVGGRKSEGGGRRSGLGQLADL